MIRNDIKPTLTDSQVLEFCQSGYLVLEGVVPDTVNERAREFLARHAEHTPTGILGEDWFVDNVLFNPVAAGAIRSLLGEGFEFMAPMLCNHRSEGPSVEQGWHRDGGSAHTHELDSLQVFYYPQDTPAELGPTEIVPGSHMLYSQSPFMQHYSDIRGTVTTAAPAGSIILTVYSVWHRRARSTATGTRHLLKYWYIRRNSPVRDWIVEEEFELAHAHHAPTGQTYQREGHRARDDVAEMFYWLCGRHDEYRGWSNNLPVYYHQQRKLCKFCDYEVR